MKATIIIFSIIASILALGAIAYVVYDIISEKKGTGTEK